MTYRLIAFALQSQAKIKLIASLIALVVSPICLRAQPSVSRAAAQGSGCGGTFAGNWTSTRPDLRLVISVNGDAMSGEHTFGKSQRLLKGRIQGDRLTGDWVEQSQQGRHGPFVAVLSADRRQIDLLFYEGQGDPIEHTIWVCSQPTSPLGVGPIGIGPGTVLFPPGVSDNHDNDQFQTFDNMPKAEQQRLLTKKGPRLPQHYNVSSFASRVFVAGGWPVVLDYGLDSDAVAVLSISVEGLKPLLVKIRPAQRDQVHIVIPDHFGPTAQVAKLTITALTRSGDPAYFHLYGIAMGKRGVQALNKLNASGLRMQLAMNSAVPTATTSDSPLFSLFTSFPQTGSGIRISVGPRTSITTGMKPKQLIAFSFRSQSVFSNGRWELWSVSGFDWTEVWQKKTGSIAPNQTKSEKWDGIISVRKIVSKGDHALQVTAWHGREEDRAWVVARADPTLVVIQ
jgi:hypothetical protein